MGKSKTTQQLEAKLDAQQKTIEGMLEQMQQMMTTIAGPKKPDAGRQPEHEAHSSIEVLTDVDVHADHEDTIEKRDSHRHVVPQRNFGRGSRTFDYSKIESLPDDTIYPNFRLWRKRWESNAKNKTIEVFSRDEQVSAVLDAMGPTAENIVRSYTEIDADDAKTSVKDILDALQQYYRGNRSITVDRLAFHSRVQGENETFAKFRCALDELADIAEICKTCRQDLITDRIIAGIYDEETQNKLLEVQPRVTLAEAMKICNACEAAEHNRKSIRNKDVNKVSTYKRNKQDRPRSRERDQSKDKKCQYCGKGSHSKDKCYAKDKKCNSCGKLGHLQSMCRTKKDDDNRDDRGRSRERRTVSNVFCGTVDHSPPRPSKMSSPFCDLKTISITVFNLDGSKLGKLKNVLPDSGSTANLMSLRDYKKLGFDRWDLRKCKDVLYGANGLTINTIGRETFRIAREQEQKEVTFIITDEYHGTILNRETCTLFGILHDKFPDCMAQVNSVMSMNLDELKANFLKEFNDVFDVNGKLKAMKGPPMHIEMMDNAVPFQVNGPRPIPIPLRQGAKDLIMDNVRQGIIEAVNEPTDWVHPFTVVRKPDGSLRLCVDLRMLNKYVKRPHHPVRTPKDAVRMIPPSAKIFTVFDAKSGYFQMEMDEASQLLTTFITPWGRFKHKRATMGLSCAGDEYNRRTDAALAGLDNMEKVVDDIIIHGDNLEQHLEDVKKFLIRCREAGITLNPKKFKLAQHEVKFAGYMVTSEGIKADEGKLKAIKNFPKPTNITDLRSFLGLVEQLAGFTKGAAEAMQPLRPLLSSKNEFYWTCDHDRAFEASKAVMLSPPVLTTFDPTRPTRLETDAARTKGLGYALLQKGKDDHWKLIEAKSRFISDTESRYAMVELELLGVKWAMEQCHIYLSGLPPFELIVDHQPLVSILNNKTLDCIDNARIRNLKAKTAPYQFTTIWRRGKDHRIPDALSRAPVDEPTKEDLEEDHEIYGHICTVYKNNVLTVQDYDEDTEECRADPMLNEIRHAGKDDTEYTTLLQYLKNGGDKLPKVVSHYKSVIDEISCQDDLLLFNQRLIIPRALRKEMLKRLHASHQGIDKTSRRARQTIYWPGITADIKSTVEACQMCQRYKLSQVKEPLERDIMPTRIFEEVAADFFELNDRHYLAMTDRYSGWLELYDIGKAPSSTDLIKCLKDYFASKGCPVRIFSDGGRQFISAETQDFLKLWGVTHRLSSPMYPQSNGLAESGVKVLKALLKKCNGNSKSIQFAEGLLELRNTPRTCGKSPAEVVFGHPLRTRVPAHHSSFNKKWLQPLDEYDKNVATQAQKGMDRYDKSARTLAPLPVGTHVLIQNVISKVWDRSGIIVAIGHHRKYQIKMPSGRLLWRNRRFLRKTSVDTTGYAQADERKTLSQDKDVSQNEKQSQDKRDSEVKLRRSKRVRFKVDRYGY